LQVRRAYDALPRGTSGLPSRHGCALEPLGRVADPTVDREDDVVASHATVVPGIHAG
jgi:hypothetical protein